MQRSYDSNEANPSVLALSGGVGGAKLALGLYRTLDPWALAVVVNTGDDFVHLDLNISPDLDTLMYTLSGENNQQLGWGRAGETWSFMQQLKRVGGDTWFQLGDGDLAIHMERTKRLNAGDSLTAVTTDLFRSFDIKAHVWPMSDSSVQTMINTADGRQLPFQHYFVKEACRPPVSDFSFVNAQNATPCPAFLEQLKNPDLEAVIICPSNPFVSIDPILSLPRVREALKACPAPVIAVSPIVGGQAIKGPAAKMLHELGLPVDAAYIASHYADLLQGIVLDSADGQFADQLGLPTLVTSTVMNSLEDRDNLAQEVLGFADRLSGRTALENSDSITASRM